MKKNLFKSSLAGIIVGLGALLHPCCHIQAAAPTAMDECSKELLLSYFPAAFVNDTLKRFNIPEDKWEGINKSLSIKDKDIVKIVEQKASSMTSNPLKDPQQRQTAVKLFRETLLQVFTDALKENGITDANKFQAMLDDIQQQKAKKFAQCMEKQKEQIQQSPKSESKDNVNLDQNDDSDDEDQDEDDSDDDNSYEENSNKSSMNKSNDSKSNSSSINKK